MIIDVGTHSTWGLIDVYHLMLTCRSLSRPVYDYLFDNRFPFDERLRRVLPSSTYSIVMMSLRQFPREVVLSGSFVLRHIVYGVDDNISWTPSDVDLFMKGMDSRDLYTEQTQAAAAAANNDPDSLQNQPAPAVGHLRHDAEADWLIPPNLYHQFNEWTRASYHRDFETSAFTTYFSPTFIHRRFVENHGRYDEHSLDVVLVRPTHNTRSCVLDHIRTLFDMSTLKCGVYAATNNVGRLELRFWTPSSLKDASAREMHVNAVSISKYNFASRVEKYMTRGFTIIYEGRNIGAEDARDVVRYRNSRSIDYTTHLHVKRFRAF